MIEKKDADKFKRLGIHSIISLATHAPSSYEDRQLYSTINANADQAIDASIENVSQTPKTLLITLYAHNLGHTIEAVIFRPKPYMLRQFIIGERHYFYGRISFNAGHTQMTHPQRITEIGKIVPKYKSVLRADVMLRLIRRYVSIENLTAEGLPQPIAERLVEIHHPKEIQPKEFDQQA
ncbi:MAG: ATP-dependent DNA helicase RecG, partial [Epsilonproteobacteria bacterium]